MACKNGQPNIVRRKKYIGEGARLILGLVLSPTDVRRRLQRDPWRHGRPSSPTKTRAPLLRTRDHPNPRHPSKHVHFNDQLLPQPFRAHSASSRLEAVQLELEFNFCCKTCGVSPPIRVRKWSRRPKITSFCSI